MWGQIANAMGMGLFLFFQARITIDTARRSFRWNRKKSRTQQSWRTSDEGLSILKGDRRKVFDFTEIRTLTVDQAIVYVHAGSRRARFFGFSHRRWIPRRTFADAEELQAFVSLLEQAGVAVEWVEQQPR